MLALPDFTIPFVIECDALSTRLGVVLMQNKHPIAFISQELKKPDKVASVYERDVGNSASHQEVEAVSSGKGICDQN